MNKNKIKSINKFIFIFYRIPFNAKFHTFIFMKNGFKIFKKYKIIFKLKIIFKPLIHISISIFYFNLF